MEKSDILMIDEQKKVENWFDKTYNNRATLYLRPVVAYQIYLTLLKVKEGGEFLDIACGTGQMLKAGLEKKLNLTGIDLSGVAVKQAQGRLPSADIRKENAEKLPFSDDKFDYITCLGSLERMLDKNKALKQMHRVLKSDGRMCILVRNSDRASWKFLKETLGFINKEGHQGAKNINDWSSVFRENNFEIENVYHDQWPRNRWLWWLSLGGRLFNYDFSKVLSFNSKVETAYELIFILRKK